MRTTSHKPSQPRTSQLFLECFVRVSPPIWIFSVTVSVTVAIVLVMLGLENSGRTSPDYKMQDQGNHGEEKKEMNQPSATWNIVKPPIHAISNTTNKSAQMVIPSHFRRSVRGKVV